MVSQGFLLENVVLDLGVLVGQVREIRVSIDDQDRGWKWLELGPFD
jgi:hypothetical protein